MKVTLTLSFEPRSVREWVLELPQPCNLATALSRVEWATDVPEDTLASLEVSVWGRKANCQTPLQNGDRIELTRPLRVDPKVARRERFQRQGVRTAGLFARRKQP